MLGIKAGFIDSGLGYPWLGVGLLVGVYAHFKAAKSVFARMSKLSAAACP
jgi:hypothetical protein